MAWHSSRIGSIAVTAGTARIACGSCRFREHFFIFVIDRVLTIAMVFFGQPPDPAGVKSFFPGISARSFSPASASVCYRECIQKENNSRSDAFESEKLRQSSSGRGYGEC